MPTLTFLYTLPFSYNWNNKFECDCYSTIRIYNPTKFVVGRQFEIKLKGEVHHQAELVHATKVQFQYLTENHARLDTGYSLEKLRDILQKMYPEYLKKHGKEAYFGFYIFQKLK